MSKRSDEMWVIVETRKQEFAVSANCVHEIVALPDVTAVPSCRPQDRGVINLRGRILPVFDMRKQFGWRSMPEELQEFCELLSKREEDHIDWLRTLEQSIAEGTEFHLATDPTKCAFGLWYNSYRSESPWITGLLRKFEQPHANIHALASAASRSANRGEVREALRLIESERKGTLQEMVSLFQQLKELMRETVKEIAMVISDARGTFVISVDRVVAVERIVPGMIKDVITDPTSADCGFMHRAIQRSPSSAPTMILEPAQFLP